MTCDIDTSTPGPFEGPEKLLEIWFAPSPAEIPHTTAENSRSGLLAVDRQIWEEMLDIVKCKVLSVVKGTEVDAYLLSESSLFICPHRLILKTCGTTLNLLGLPRILSIARTYAKLPHVYRCFYSRKSFMFPERQLGPHKEWTKEVEFLDRIFDNGSAYTVGKVNGDHWLLYITDPAEITSGSGTEPESPSLPMYSIPDGRHVREGLNGVTSLLASPPAQDYTIEILMTHLSPRARAAFYTPLTHTDSCAQETVSPSTQAQVLSSQLGISDIFPRHLTQLDAYSFSPCGYSANALLNWGGDDEDIGEGYYTIHVTPEEGWSYASFECNVPLPTHVSSTTGGSDEKGNIPDLQTLIRRVVRIFQPDRLTLTLFISSANNNSADEYSGETAVEVAQRAFKAALTGPSGAATCKGVSATNKFTMMKGNRDNIHVDVKDPYADRIYKRTDKINYEFGGYDLAFASFEVKT